MAKKLILAGFVLFYAIFFNNLLYAGAPRDTVEAHRECLLSRLETASNSPVRFSPVSSPSPGSSSGSGVRFREARPARDRRVSRPPVEPVVGWWSWLPSKNQVDRALCAAALIGVGLAFGLTVSTCSDMKGTCATAQSELRQYSGLLQELKRIGVLVCRLDPTLCSKS